MRQFKTPEYADLIGVPFEHNARGPESLDCYGLLMEMYRRQGVHIPDFRPPNDAGAIQETIVGAQNKWRETRKKPGAAMWIRVKGRDYHVGYYLGYDKFLHAWEKSGGVCVERLHYWERKVKGFYNYVQ